MALAILSLLVALLSVSPLSNGQVSRTNCLLLQDTEAQGPTPESGGEVWASLRDQGAVTGWTVVCPRGGGLSVSYSQGTMHPQVFGGQRRGCGIDSW